MMQEQIQSTNLLTRQMNWILSWFQITMLIWIWHKTCISPQMIEYTFRNCKCQPYHSTGIHGYHVYIYVFQNRKAILKNCFFLFPRIEWFKNFMLWLRFCRLGQICEFRVFLLDQYSIHILLVAFYLVLRQNIVECCTTMNSSFINFCRVFIWNNEPLTRYVKLENFFPATDFKTNH